MDGPWNLSLICRYSRPVGSIGGGSRLRVCGGRETLSVSSNPKDAMLAIDQECQGYIDISKSVSQNCAQLGVRRGADKGGGTVE